MDKFHIRLKECREKKKKVNSKWTQGYIAKKIGVARPTYTAYENGTKQPPLDTINRIADILEVTTDYMLGRTDNPNMTEEQEYQSFTTDPELQHFFRDIEASKEQEQHELRQIWEIIKQRRKEKNDD